MVLFLKHALIEGPASLGQFFKRSGLKTKIVELYRAERIPELSGIKGVVSLGGPMSVYEVDKYPFLKEEEGFLKEVLKRKIPFLGICLGAQLLAKIKGAKVKPLPKEEVGWCKVELTPQGKKDPLFQGIRSPLEVFQWHQETFNIPRRGLLLARARFCKNQAFRIGECAWGLQFHLEMNRAMLLDWIKDKPSALRKGLLNKYVKIQRRYYSQRERFFLNFLRIIKGCLGE